MEWSGIVNVAAFVVDHNHSYWSHPKWIGRTIFAVVSVVGSTINMDDIVVDGSQFVSTVVMCSSYYLYHRLACDHSFFLRHGDDGDDDDGPRQHYPLEMVVVVVACW